MISTEEITNIEQYYFKENNKEPFPIQRIRWLEKIIPYTKTTFISRFIDLIMIHYIKSSERSLKWKANI